MVRDTPPSQDASTHQIWNSYLKEYRRYGPDTKAGRTDGHTDGHTDGLTDGRMDSAITTCLPKFLWGHKKNSIITQNSKEREYDQEMKQSQTADPHQIGGNRKHS